MIAGSNRKNRFPVLTALALGLAVLVTSTRLFSDGPLDALRRDPAALGDGQIWRLISPVLVQSDSGIGNVLLVFATCAAIGIIAERLLSPASWLTFYFCGALAGHALGEAFQPLEGGTSVAFVGILGGLGALVTFGRDPVLKHFRWQALLAIPLSILDIALGDIHGVSYLVCFTIGSIWMLRERPDTASEGTLRCPAPPKPESADRTTRSARR